MSLILDTLLFLLGVHLAIRTVAAFYRVIDLWYTIRSAYPGVLGGIALWGGAVILLATILPESRRSPFLWGAAGFVLFYLALYALRPLILRRRESPPVP